MKSKRKYIRVIILFVISFLFFGALFRNSTQFSSIRNEKTEQIITIDNNGSISQKLALCNTTNVSMELLVNCVDDDQEANVEITVSEAKKVLKKKVILLSELNNQEWNNLEITEGELKNFKGNVWVNLKLKNANAGSNISFVNVHSNKNYFPIYTECKINATKNNNSYFIFTIDYFNATFAFVFAAILGAILTVILTLIKNYKRQIYCIIKENYVLLLGFGVIVFSFIKSNPYRYDDNPWTFFIYLIGYRYGLISKAFPGVILGIFVKYITKNIFVTFILAITLLVYLVEIILIKMKAKNSDIDVAQINAIAMVYFFSPWFLSGTANVGMFGHPDIFVILIYLLCLLCFIYEKMEVILPVFTVAGVLTHQQFVFIVFPFFSIIMLYKAVKRKKNKILYLITIIVSAIFSIWSQFIGNINIPLEQLVIEMQKKTDMTVDKAPYYWEFYASIKEVIKSMALPNIYKWQYVVLAFIVSLPYVIYVRDILQYSKKKSDDTFEKALLHMVSISFLGVFILWALAADWGRYVFVYANVMFLFLIYCVKDGNVLHIGEGIVFANQKMEERLGKKWEIFLVLYAVLCGIGSWGAGSFYDRINPYFDSITKYVLNFLYSIF